MSIIEAIVLGLVQGLTEFIPISSTAHLEIVPVLLGWGDPGAAASAVLQFGTWLAAIVAQRLDHHGRAVPRRGARHRCALLVSAQHPRGRRRGTARALPRAPPSGAARMDADLDLHRPGLRLRLRLDLVPAALSPHAH